MNCPSAQARIGEPTQAARHEESSLDLSLTQVGDLTALKDVKSLTWLDLSGMPVADVTALKDLKSLHIRR